MKELFLCSILLLNVLAIPAQEITISFQPKVSGTKIDSIRATNLRTTQVVKLLGSESLLLVKTPTGIHPVSDPNEISYIYPNPTDEDAAFCFSTTKTQEVEIRLHNANGQLLEKNRHYLEQGTHRFELKFPVAGIYFVSVLKSESSASLKAVYTGRKNQTSSIQFEGSEKSNSEKPVANQLKSAKTDKSLAYSDGDIIQYSVSSGVNTTILTETPTVSKAINVEFVNCTDKDGKSYKVVKTGSQWWMAENLAYLPAVSGSKAGSNSEPYYYVYGYEGTDATAAKATSNYKTYGVLYNWPAAKAACPPGWHLPNDAEWTALETILGGYEVAGGKLKEAGTIHWFSPNTGATNESSFSFLPSGYRDGLGYFNRKGYISYLWSSREENSENAWYRFLFYNGSSLEYNSNYKQGGFSVRCVRD